MVALSKISPLDQARAFAKSAMLADYGGLHPVSLERMGARIGYKSISDMHELMTGNPSPRILAMACNYFSIPQPSAWDEHVAAAPALTVVPDPVDDSVPVGFVRVTRGKSGPAANAQTALVVITGSMVFSANRAAHRMLDNAPMVSLLTNADERKLLIVPAHAKGEDTYVLQGKNGRITATHAARTVIEWGWTIGVHYLAVPMYGGIMLDGEVAK